MKTVDETFEDQPITSSQDDILGRTPFVNSIAKAIRSYHGKESLVIGIYGPWGSGKTSVINLLKNELLSEEITRPDIVEFNPWQWSSQEKILTAFFSTVEIALKRKKCSTDESKMWRKLSAIFGFTSFMSDGIRLTFVAITGILGATSFVGQYVGMNIQIAISLSTGFGILSALMGFSESFASKTAMLFDAYRTNSDLEATRNDLKKKMRDRKKPLLVIIDDIDRLTAEEVRSLFTIVKSNADFPNIIYLMLFQRNIVEKHLEKLVENSGAEYLKKIVQLPFELPVSSHSKISRLLERGLDKILTNYNVDNKFQKDRWFNIYTEGVQEYFHNIRDVKRFINFVDFSFGSFYKNNVLEVNPVDLIGLECIKMFEPIIYNKLPFLKSELTALKVRENAFARTNTQSPNIFQEIISAANSSHTNHAQKMLFTLFPSIENNLADYTSDHSSHDEWALYSRICHVDYFDRYFYMALFDNEVTNAELENIVKISTNYDELMEIFRSAIQRKRGKDLIEKLNNRRNSIPPDNSEPYLKALCDIAEEVDDEIPSAFDISSFRYLGSLFDAHIRKVKRGSERLRVLLTTFENCKGIDLPLYFMSFERQAENEPEDDNHLISKEEFEKIKNALVAKIVQKSQNKSLISSKYLMVAIDRWAEWGDIKQVKKYLSEIISSPQGAISLVTAAINKKMIYSTGEPKIEWVTDVDRIGKYVDIEKLYESLSKIDTATLEPNEKRGVEVFLRSKRYKDLGKSYENSFEQYE